MNRDKQEQLLIERVQQLTGVRDAEMASRVTGVVLSVLAEQLGPHDRGKLVRALPERRGTALAHADVTVNAADTLASFYDRVAARAGAEPGFSLEHAQSVCRVLTERLDEESRTSLVRSLPDALAELFARPEPRAAVARAPQLAGSTLAEGRPGSGQPVSEARTGSTRPVSERAPQPAHQDAVARSDNPHQRTKLSSAAGLTQEREDETLARGRSKL